MKTRKITISIPSWVPTKYQLRDWKKKVKQFFFPPRCVGCKCKVPNEYSNAYGKYTTGTHPLGFKNSQAMFIVKVYAQMCGPCLKKHIHTLSLPNGKCTMCEKKDVPVMGYTSENPTIIFLWHWWNGSQFCLDCVDDLLDTGTYQETY